MATLAPPRSPPRPKSIRPVPASSRPVRTPTFPFKNLLRVPIRIFSPPKATGMVGSVRSLKATPLNDVRLADVVENKHLSPLSLKDFEGHLVFREYSAENLYFLLWLNEYEKEWQAWQAEFSALNDPTSMAQLPQKLQESLQRGLDIFLTPDGALELNLSDATRDKAYAEASIHGNPADFAGVREIVQHSLNRSLAAHSRACVANAGPRRLVFCFCLGLSVVLLGLIAPFVAIFGNHARAWRVIGLPFIWFGVSVMVMAVNRICGVIFLFGEDRQLLRYEVETPRVFSGSIVDMGPATPRSSSSSWDEEPTYDDEKSPASSFLTQTSAAPYPWEKHEPSALVDFSSSINSPASSKPPSYVARKSPTIDLVPSSARVWGPVTKVFSPDVLRAQYKLAIFAFMSGVVGLLTIGTVLMAVPNA